MKIDDRPEIKYSTNKYNLDALDRMITRHPKSTKYKCINIRSLFFATTFLAPINIISHYLHTHSYVILP